MHAFDYCRGAIPVDECQAVVDESFELLGRTRSHQAPSRGAGRPVVDRAPTPGGNPGERLGRTVPEVVFVDTDDAGGAAVAAALLARYARGRVNTSSAGQKPAAGMEPALVRVATDLDLDLDLAGAFPRSWCPRRSPRAPGRRSRRHRCA